MTAPLFVPHRRYSDADDAFRRYVELCGRSMVRAQDITMGARIVPAQWCENPSCRPDPNARRVTINGIERCSRCRAEWRFVEVGSLGISIRSSAEGIARRMHAHQAERATLAIILHRRPPHVSWDAWVAQRAAWALALYGRANSTFARHCVAAVTTHGESASERSLARLVREVRDEIENRLEGGGLLGS